MSGHREAKLRDEISELKKRIREASAEKSDTDISSFKKKVGSGAIDIKVRRTLRGHTQKIYNFDVCQDQPNYIVTSSQDGKLIVWNALTTHKIHVIPLVSQWVTCCAYSPGGRTVVSGGLDNTIYVYELGDEPVPEVSMELKEHEGSILHMKYLGDGHLISTSGDRTIINWDFGEKCSVRKYSAHDGDVLCVDTHYEEDRSVFITGSLDKTAMLWDVRSSHPELSFTGHTQEVNAIKFFPNKNSFITGSEDGVIRWYDLRADRELSVYGEKKGSAPVVSVCFSNSGRYILSATETFCKIWDSLTGSLVEELDHDSTVSCVGTTHGGQAALVSTWNGQVKVYA